VEADGTVYFAADAAGTAYIGGNNAIFDIKTGSGTFSYGNGFYSVDSGAVTLTAKGSSSDTVWFQSEEGDRLIIKDNAKFVVDNNGGSEVRVKSLVANPAIQGAAGAEIEVKTSASFSFKTGSDSNFYDNSGALINVETSLADKTYEWDEDADGNGAFGWKATS
jgi:hypothetical protein